MTDKLKFNEFVTALYSRGSFDGAVDPVDKSVLVHPMAGDSVYSVYVDFERFINASNPGAAASALVALQNSMDSLVTWLPGYDYETGELTPLEDQDA